VGRGRSPTRRPPNGSSPSRGGNSPVLPLRRPDCIGADRSALNDCSHKAQRSASHPGSGTGAPPRTSRCRALCPNGPPSARCARGLPCGYGDEMVEALGRRQAKAPVRRRLVRFSVKHTRRLHVVRSEGRGPTAPFWLPCRRSRGSAIAIALRSAAAPKQKGMLDRDPPGSVA
jgi:hypothetical protein